jgi:eukaryotic-like serine/threonine-protein kinase
LGDLWISHWSSDGKTLILTQFPTKRGNYGIWTVALSGDRKVQPLIDTPADETNASVSPDGRWIAYDSRESGRDEIYVQAFSGSGSKFQVSTAGGQWPAWRRDGKELFFLSLDNRLMSVPVQTAPSFESGAPVAFSDPLRVDHFAMMPDGARFLVQFPLPEPIARGARLILNWPAELKH